MPSGFRYSSATPPLPVSVPIKMPNRKQPVAEPVPEPIVEANDDDVLMEIPHTIIKNKTTSKLNVSLYITVRDKESADQAKELLQLVQELGL
jgi:hypothetical protein